MATVREEILVLGYDQQCTRCSGLAQGVEDASSGSLKVIPLKSHEFGVLLERANGSYRHAQTLIDPVAGKVYRGFAIAVQLARRLGMGTAWRIASEMWRLRAKIEGRGEPVGISRSTFISVIAGITVGMFVLGSARAANASASSHPSSGTTSDNWPWSITDAVVMSDDERLTYGPMFEDDLAAAEAIVGPRTSEAPPSMAIATNGETRTLALATPIGAGLVYVRHLEVTQADELVRASTAILDPGADDDLSVPITLLAQAEDGGSAAAQAMGQEPVDLAATAAAAAAKCGPGTHSCRACSEYDRGAVIACCAGCAFSGNWALFLACAIVVCSLCLGQNCTKWTYACCTNQ